MAPGDGGMAAKCRSAAAALCERLAAPAAVSRLRGAQPMGRNSTSWSGSVAAQRALLPPLPPPLLLLLLPSAVGAAALVGGCVSAGPVRPPPLLLLSTAEGAAVGFLVAYGLGLQGMDTQLIM